MFNELIVSVEKNDIKLVRKLIKKGVNLNQRDCSGNTPLIVAAKNNNPIMVRLLLETGANVDLQNDCWDTALIISAGQSDSFAVVELLINAGADVHQQNSSGDTALIAATMRINCLFTIEGKEVINLLLYAGSDIYHNNFCGKTVFKISNESGCQDLLELFHFHEFHKNRLIAEVAATQTVIHSMSADESVHEVTPTPDTPAETHGPLKQVALTCVGFTK